MDGKEIKRLRDRLGLTQRELGEKLGVDQGTISRWEREVEAPRSKRKAALQALLLGNLESRQFDRAVAIVRNDILPSSLLDGNLRFVEASASGIQHLKDRDQNLERMRRMAFRHASARIFDTRLTDALETIGFIEGHCLLFRFSMNYGGRGHTTVWEPIFLGGELKAVLNYVTQYFEAETCEGVRLERIDYVLSAHPDELKNFYDFYAGN